MCVITDKSLHSRTILSLFMSRQDAIVFGVRVFSLISSTCLFCGVWQSTLIENFSWKRMKVCVHCWLLCCCCCCEVANLEEFRKKKKKRTKFSCNCNCNPNYSQSLHRRNGKFAQNLTIAIVELLNYFWRYFVQCCKIMPFIQCIYVRRKLSIGAKNKASHCS